MDLALRCNTLSCRATLSDKAVVTTCSHIFCPDCGDNTGLSRSSEASRFCPACKAALPNPDDAVTTVLKPTEDYKTSVLSGLDPAVIMECASRGLAFWTYQASQEVSFYQEWLGKNLTEKYSSLSSKMDKVIEEANSEIGALQNKISGLQLDQSSLVNKNRELFQMYTEKNKKQQQTQHLYDTLKKRILMSQVQTAASDTVNRTVDSFASAARPETFDASALHQNEEAAPGSRLRQSPNLASNLNGGGVLHPHDRGGHDARHSADILTMPPPGRPAAHRPQTQAPTPQHRTHLPGTRVSAVRSQIPLSTNHTSHVNGVHHLDHPPSSAIRQSASRPSGNRTSHSGSSGYGISAGIKMGRASGTGSGYRDARTEANRGSASFPAPLRDLDQRGQSFAHGYF